MDGDRPADDETPMNDDVPKNDETPMNDGAWDGTDKPKRAREAIQRSRESFER